ncbi:hypothetical protein CUZ95_1143 [Enterococcus lactis]|nr:hypothetical protein [Enterococcus lactis]
MKISGSLFRAFLFIAGSGKKRQGIIIEGTRNKRVSVF